MGLSSFDNMDNEHLIKSLSDNGKFQHWYYSDTLLSYYRYIIFKYEQTKHNAIDVLKLVMFLYPQGEKKQRKYALAFIPSISQTA